MPHNYTALPTFSPSIGGAVLDRNGNPNGGEIGAKGGSVRLKRRPCLYLSGAFLALIFLISFATPSDYTPAQVTSLKSTLSSNFPSWSLKPSEPSLSNTAAALHPLASSVVLNLKTGHSVAYSRLPYHLLDSRPDIPNRNFYSDAPLNIAGIEVKDILANVPLELQQSKEFRTYGKLQKALRDGLPVPAEYSGWQLDKYKFFPLHGDAYRNNPDLSWQISIDGDTYIFFNTLLEWLSHYDPSEEHYFGRTEWGNSTFKFAHGGSGYALSKGILDLTYGTDPIGWPQDQKEYVEHWFCGDCALAAKIYEFPGTTLTQPDGGDGYFLSEPARTLGFDEKNWFDPVFTLHHLTPGELFQTREFEKALLPTLPKGDFVRRCDVFEYFLPAYLRAPIDLIVSRNFAQNGLYGVDGDVIKQDWWAEPTNQLVCGKDCADARGKPFDAQFCQGICDEDPTCFFWTFAPKKECSLSRLSIRFGSPTPEKEIDFSNPKTSGWRVDRIAKYYFDPKNGRSCKDQSARKAADEVRWAKVQKDKALSIATSFSHTQAPTS